MSKDISIVLMYSTLFAKEVVQLSMTSLTSVNVSGEESICTRPFASRMIALGAKQHGQIESGSDDEHVKMVQNFIEFVLLKEQIQSRFKLVEKHVNSLFDVQLKRTKEEDNLRCWVKLEGSEHDISRAKVRERKFLVSLHFDFRRMKFKLAFINVFVSLRRTTSSPFARRVHRPFLPSRRQF